MGKYTHLNPKEAAAHAEKFGTPDERELVSKIQGDWENCPECRERDDSSRRAWGKIEDALGKISDAMSKFERAEIDMARAQDELS